jgi:hypothetical protein
MTGDEPAFTDSAGAKALLCDVLPDYALLDAEQFSCLSGGEVFDESGDDGGGGFCGAVSHLVSFVVSGGNEKAGIPMRIPALHTVRNLWL